MDKAQEYVKNLWFKDSYQTFENALNDCGEVEMYEVVDICYYIKYKGNLKDFKSYIKKYFGDIFEEESNSFIIYKDWPNNYWRYIELRFMKDDEDEDYNITVEVNSCE